MNGDGGDKQQNLVKPLVSGVVLGIHARQMVQVGYQPVRQIQANGSGEDACHGDEHISIVQRGKNQPQHGGGQHDPRGKGQHQVAEPVRYVLDQESGDSADNRCAAHTQGGQ